MQDFQVKLDITHSSLKNIFAEVRFYHSFTIGYIKEIVSNKTGTSISHMRLILRDRDNNDLCTLDDDDMQLGFYSPMDGMILHCVDSDKTSITNEIAFTDISTVEKFEISEAEYEKRNDSFRAFKRRNPKMFEKKCNEEEIVAPSDWKVGDRVEIKPADHRGTIRYIGSVSGLNDGDWIGIELDEPFGKNDGSFEGKRYFDSDKGFGIFLRPKRVVVGDFPPIDVLDLLSSDDDL
eukprot:TRINITY_DN1744_c0_g1_i1.p1 TRINITY_DN1744_c0_g1~~TRINITY_DN1744_c0_g1_i1.p1  ORF type:complete len:247 (+),score=70.80 TRINITY_DN1744_c0_g1_i1:37-741(+)